MPARTILAATVLVPAALLLPATAAAGTVTATNDAGQPAPIPEGGSLQVRHMAPEVTPAFSSAEKRYTLIITGPDGKSAGNDAACAATQGAGPQTINYAGNGAYAIRLVTWTSDDIFCESASTTQNFTLVIAASVTMTGPASPVLYREAGGSRRNFSFNYDINPGNSGYDFVWAYDAKFGPGGAIVGDYPRDDSGTRGSGAVTGTLDSIVFPRAGTVSIVGAARGSRASSPFSAPLTLKLIGPFDWSQTPGFTGGSGTSQVVGAEVYEPGAIGKKVSVLLAKGRGKFKPLVTRTIPASRKLSFRIKRPRGKYRLKYVFKGAEFVAAGAWSQSLTLGRTSSSLGRIVRAAP